MSRTRLISDMSPEEREQKRTADRVNKRHSRARGKLRFEELERRYSQVSQQLSEANDELCRLRCTLNKVQNAFSIIQDSLTDFRTTCSTKDVANTDAQDETARTQEPQAVDIDSNNLEVSEPLEIQCLDRLPGAASLNALEDNSQGDASEPEISWQVLLDPLQDYYSMHLLGEHGNDVSVDLLSEQRQYTIDSESLTNELYPLPLPVHHFDTSSHNPISTTESTSNRSEIPIWELLPAHLPPQTLLDTVLLRVTESGRGWTRSQGRQHSEMLQSAFPSISSLLNPDVNDAEDNPISSAIGRHTWRSSAATFTARISFHYMVANLIRWLVHSTKETYYMLPDFMRPTLIQRTVPHPAWIDVIPWPQARDLAIQEMDFSEFERFRSLTGNYSINWTYPDEHVLLLGKTHKDLTLNPVFVAHIRNLNNWTLPQEAVDAFPFLRNCPTNINRKE